MAVDGTYEITIDTPMGAQTATLTLKTDGDALSGKIDSPLGAQEFSGGSVSGDDITWQMEIDSPMGKINLEYKAKVTGDDIAGEVKAGGFGSSPLKGKRV
ncbi:MAG TPA: hypothetical protein G4O16_02715 [Dehalococcoidia bacterium]|nr:hypothetical protein [Dehalococcoidia bacterium]